MCTDAETVTDIKLISFLVQDANDEDKRYFMIAYTHYDEVR